MNIDAVKKVFRECFLGACHINERDISLEFEGHLPRYEREFERWWAVNDKNLMLRLDVGIKGAGIEIVPVTPARSEEYGFKVDRSRYMWSIYKGWRGTILKEDNNGDNPAYLVRISNDGHRFINTVINKTDVQFINEVS